MQIKRPKFKHIKSMIHNGGCPCCQRMSHKAVKRLSHRIARRMAKKDIEKELD